MRPMFYISALLTCGYVVEVWCSLTGLLQIQTGFKRIGAKVLSRHVWVKHHCGEETKIAICRVAA
jgi:hypothetical protein